MCTTELADGALHTVDDFPVLLARVLGQGPPHTVRSALAENIYEEQTGKLSLGVPHPELGEEVKAVVQTEAGASITDDEVRRWVADGLAGFKVPAHVWFRDQPLPRNANGKFVKRDLREEYVGS